MSTWKNDHVFGRDFTALAMKETTGNKQHVSFTSKVQKLGNLSVAL